ncbi:unnamed protein product [Phaedon cochleariae]|uniref:Uncharacterized protein n=1 Tax=Phaedon cochleariae TaxID=80249 RepID=A0A9N9X1A7_PHACE|nr:unnamed protein product [Phaedon cochleariae]
MLKLKVSFNHLFCPLFFSHRPRKKHIYFTSLIKTLRHFNPVSDKHFKDKIQNYWANPSIPEILSFADRLYEEEQYLEAYELLNRIRLLKEPEVLWRLARVLYIMSLDKDVTADVKWEMTKEAKKLLTIAVDIGQYLNIGGGL